MSLHVLDTDILVLFQEGHDRVLRHVLSKPAHCGLVNVKGKNKVTIIQH